MHFESLWNAGVRRIGFKMLKGLDSWSFRVFRG
jgi:hypothetical protein